MGTFKKIKVLVVDDSVVFQEVLTRLISVDPVLEVVARASNPFDARDKIIQFEPDVMTCDVEMPKMNGIEFIRRLLPQYPLPVIVVSGVSNTVFDALNAGAVDFIAKPSALNAEGLDKFVSELIVKIKTAATAKVTVQNSFLITDMAKKEMDFRKIIAIGASTGGTEALYKVLKSLPPRMPGILIVQHIPPIFSKMFADRLNSQMDLHVKEAEEGDTVESGKVLIAPGDRHMRLIKGKTGFRVNLFCGEKVNGHCPSVDVLFESVAAAVGAKGVGVILTGMGRDGAMGLLAMRRGGARTIGQDEQSSVVYGMPKVAYEIGAVEKQASLLKIPQLLFEMLR